MMNSFLQLSIFKQEFERKTFEVEVYNLNRHFSIFYSTVFQFEK